jgi:methylated-DNA-[protein]-cysteine S-methyltransferase
MRAETGTVSLTVETIATPIGDLELVADEDGSLRAAEFADCRHRVDRWLRQRYGSAGYKLVTGTVAAEIRNAFARYFAGDLSAMAGVPIRLDGTTFQNEVWTALRRIKPGETSAYGAFARMLGRPQSARAVGHANGTNPLSIVVPCHRLVGANGDLTNYGGGIERKRWLLDQRGPSQPTGLIVSVEKRLDNSAFAEHEGIGDVL